MTDSIVPAEFAAQNAETRGEAPALSTWHGQRAVPLLERLDSGRSLDDEPIGLAVEVAGSLLPRRPVAAVPPITRWAAR